MSSLTQWWNRTPVRLNYNVTEVWFSHSTILLCTLTQKSFSETIEGEVGKAYIKSLARTLQRKNFPERGERDSPEGWCLSVSIRVWEHAPVEPVTFVVVFVFHGERAQIRSQRGHYDALEVFVWHTDLVIDPSGDKPTRAIARYSFGFWQNPLLQSQPQGREGL